LQSFSGNDVICFAPKSMRFTCAIVIALMVISVGAGMANSIQLSKAMSVSFCRGDSSTTGGGSFCPNESFFAYYRCCQMSTSEQTRCCARKKIWLLVAVVSSACAFLLVMFTLLYQCFASLRLLFRRRRCRAYHL
ncbi:hypothetical protein Tcan_16126, partial [Toxocara canis]